ETNSSIPTGIVYKTTTDPERNEWKKQHVVSMENSENFFIFTGPVPVFEFLVLGAEHKKMNSKLG
ncbi:hypothetical protein J0J30_22135, partial [Vibrio vulnificus]|nr:hypothetical protein [Vibrio vulnificus]